MKIRFVLALGAIVSISLVVAAEKGEWGQYKPLKGSYLIYSGDLSEMQRPTKNERKISFVVNGPVAKDMFDSMGPDLKQGCSSDKGYRERNKGEVTCVHDADGYMCQFGFDLRTGASIAGGYC